MNDIRRTVQAFAIAIFAQLLIVCASLALTIVVIHQAGAVRGAELMVLANAVVGLPLLIPGVAQRWLKHRRASWADRSTYLTMAGALISAAICAVIAFCLPGGLVPAALGYSFGLTVSEISAALLSLPERRAEVSKIQAALKGG